MDALAQANGAKQEELGETAKLSSSIGMMTSIVVSGVSVVLGSVLAWLIGAGISNPIRAITGALTNLAGGGRTVEIPGQDHRDEIGAMAEAVQVFKENMIRNDELQAEQELAVYTDIINPFVREKVPAKEYPMEQHRNEVTLEIA